MSSGEVCGGVMHKSATLCSVLSVIDLTCYKSTTSLLDKNIYKWLLRHRLLLCAESLWRHDKWRHEQNLLSYLPLTMLAQKLGFVILLPHAILKAAGYWCSSGSGQRLPNYGLLSVKSGYGSYTRSLYHGSATSLRGHEVWDQMTDHHGQDTSKETIFSHTTRPYQKCPAICTAFKRSN